jgi:hypothetical protein
MHAREPVDHRVMHLHQRRDVPALEPLDHVELPERLRPVERAREDPLDLFAELEPAAGVRERGASDVEVQVERGVVHPDRQRQPERDHLDLLPQARRQVQARREHLLHVLEP